MKEQGLSADDELIYLHEFEYITLARVLLAEYQESRDESAFLKALELLERLLKAAEDRQRLRSILEVLVTQVIAYQVKGDLSKAHASLEHALALAQPEGFFRIFVDEGEPLRATLMGFRGSMEKQSRGKNHELWNFVNKLLSVSALPKRMQHSELVEPLSQRELEILRLLQTELSVPEIAGELVIAVSTIRTHTKSIFSKLNVNNRRAAVKRAAELNLI